MKPTHTHASAFDAIRTSLHLTHLPNPLCYLNWAAFKAMCKQIVSASIHFESNTISKEYLRFSNSRIFTVLIRDLSQKYDTLLFIFCLEWVSYLKNFNCVFPIVKLRFKKFNFSIVRIGL